MFLPMIIMCSLTEPACQAFSGKPMPTEEQCKMDIAMNGIPKLGAQFEGRAEIKEVLCIELDQGV